MMPNTIAQPATSQTSSDLPPRSRMRRAASQSATKMPATMHSA